VGVELALASTAMNLLRLWRTVPALTKAE
jgi:hypothetical protein